MRTERNVMIAASRSRPECKASERTPKLPVRTTKNVLSETSSKAEPTLNSAARFFSRPSSIGWVATIARLDYLICPHSLEWPLLYPVTLFTRQVHRSALACQAKTMYFLAGHQETLL